MQPWRHDIEFHKAKSHLFGKYALVHISDWLVIFIDPRVISD
jgi:hypothetical protein